MVLSPSNFFDSLKVKTTEPPLDLRRLNITLQYFTSPLKDTFVLKKVGAQDTKFASINNLKTFQVEILLNTV